MRAFLCYLIALFSLGAGNVVQTLAADTNSSSLKNVAGDYYFGDGTGVNCTFQLDETGSFTFQWHGCLGMYDENNGSASIQDGVLHISPKKPNIQEGFRGTPTDFFPVRWVGRMYLIPTNEIVAFCSDVNQGSEPRRDPHGKYYLRQNDWEKAVTGKPEVPKHWTNYFLSQPVRGKITELIGKAEAWVNVGADAGLLEGMVLTAQTQGELMFSQVRVEVVEKSRCRVKCKWQDSELVLGQTVSSVFFDPSDVKDAL